MATVIECENCGEPGSSGDRFCGSCGHPRVEPRVPPAAAPLQPAAAPLQQPPLDRGPAQPAAPPPPPAAPVAPPPLPPAPATPRVFGPPRDRALDSLAANSIYTGVRNIYERTPEPPCDPIRSTRYLGEILRHALVYLLVWWLIGLVLFVPCVLIAAASRSGAILGLYFVGATVSAVGFAVLWLFVPIPAMLSEWKFGVDDKGDRRTEAFEHITWSFLRREPPVTSTRIRNISQPGVDDREYLEVKQGVFLGYVSCFAYGRDLFVGWTQWLYLSPFRWLLLCLARIWHTATQRGTELMVTLRYESARAMRESLHASCRDGVDVANGEITAQGRGIVGTDVPVDQTALTLQEST